MSELSEVNRLADCFKLKLIFTSVKDQPFETETDQ